MPQLESASNGTASRRENIRPSGMIMTSLRVGNPWKASNGGITRHAMATTIATPTGPRLSTMNMKLPAASTNASGTANWCQRV
ncbi:hypothetical protein D3C71_1382750 [compost metagenome]